MKQILLSLLFAIMVVGNVESKSSLVCKVDERVELARIISHIIGIDNYDPIVPYLKDIDSCSTKYQNHPFIDYVREWQREKNIDRPIIVLSCLLLDQEEEGFVFNSSNEELEGLLHMYISYDEYLNYVTLLNSFYRDANFAELFEKHAKWFAIQEEVMNKEYFDKINQKFFEKTFGKPFGERVFYVCLDQNVPSSFFVPFIRVNGVLKGAYYYNKAQTSSYRKNFYVSMQDAYIHILAHSFVDKYIKGFDEETYLANSIFYSRDKDKFDDYNISENSVFSEYVANMIVALYDSRLNSKNIMRTLNMCSNWAGLVEHQKLLEFVSENFINNKKEYSTVNSFLPELVKYYVELSK